MIPETSVNWKAFEYKFSDNPQRAFENLTYYLFCNEYGQKNGIFRYFNQPHIETNPIQVGDKLIGFQAKYYAESVAMSSKEEDLRKAVEGASKAYPGITTLYFYISREFSPSSEKDKVKPAYQTNIENGKVLVILKPSLCKIRDLQFVEMFFFKWILQCRSVVKVLKGIKKIYLTISGQKYRTKIKRLL